MSTSAKGITFEEALTRVSSKFNLKYHFKLEQVECMRDLAEGKNVFAVLPTGYGKSDIFGFLPAVMNEMNPDINHHALVVSPLRALMRDQVARWSELGIEAVAILQNCEMSSIEVEGLDRGHYKIIFMSPEILHVEKWVSMLKKHRNTFCLVAFDEVHCLVEWGGTFRPVYKQLGKIRSLLPDAPIVALTATANDKVKHMVIESLHMEYEDFSHIAVVPNRANIFLTIDTDKQAAIEEKLQWYSILLRQKLNHAPKCVIYVSLIEDQTEENPVQEEAVKSPKKLRRYRPRFFVDRSKPQRRSGGVRQTRRFENLNFLLSLVELEEDGCKPELMEPPMSALDQLFMEHSKMKIWNDFMNRSEEDQQRLLDGFSQARQLGFEECKEKETVEPMEKDASLDFEKVDSVDSDSSWEDLQDKRVVHPAHSAEDCFKRIDVQFKNLLKKRHIPWGTLAMLEEEIMTFFHEWPTTVFVSQLSNGFERMLLHALCQYLDLHSHSYNDDQGARQTQVENKRDHFTPPAVTLTQYLEMKH